MHLADGSSFSSMFRLQIGVLLSSKRGQKPQNTCYVGRVRLTLRWFFTIPWSFMPKIWMILRHKDFRMPFVSMRMEPPVFGGVIITPGRTTINYRQRI
ncbi:hypothetical protein N7471_005149 [Penicillium samsonianum]|uniref:uncharacterized protein n=1 Tax=Penicillium samsonianum TaxID=1882272 RepID=UPI002549A61A|nr:uncharacterized protein N7471_005149 [Penicillium samsonianum]KAJ6138663.1 hypothetical protein N7471_005149 [Penicillium samsonianum]